MVAEKTRSSSISRSFFRSFVILPLVILTVSTHDAGAAAEMEKKTMLYQLMWEADNVVGEVAINGFVVTELEGSSGNGSACLNPWLTGNNELRVVLKKADPAATSAFVFGVSELAAGTMTSTTDRGKLFSLEIKDTDFAKSAEVGAGKTFRSTLDFSRHLRDAGVITPTEVLAYATKFYALFEKKDVDGILQESAVRIEDYAEAFGGQDFRSALKAYLVDDLLKDKLVKIEPDELRAVPVGPTKKIWHVLSGHDELIRTTSDDGSSGAMPVYVGQVDGKLAVVR